MWGVGVQDRQGEKERGRRQKASRPRSEARQSIKGEMARGIASPKRSTSNNQRAWANSGGRGPSSSAARCGGSASPRWSRCRRRSNGGSWYCPRCRPWTAGRCDCGGCWRSRRSRGGGSRFRGRRWRGKAGGSWCRGRCGRSRRVVQTPLMGADAAAWVVVGGCTRTGGGGFDYVRVRLPRYARTNDGWVRLCALHPPRYTHTNDVYTPTRHRRREVRQRAAAW